MGFFDKIRAGFSRFMSGRYGADQLGHEMSLAAIVLMLAGSLSGVRLISMMGDAMLLLMLFRMFSHNRYKRAQENRDYLEKTMKPRRAAGEWANRVKNRKRFAYFSCPKCKMRLRVPRGVGKVTITCKGCGEKFDKKA